MLWIAHRGNLCGPRPDLENSPIYIEGALQRGFNVEIDVWYTDQYYLGHDRPQYPVSREFLSRPGLWCHAKNLPALWHMLNDNCHCFWHDTDAATLTSLNYIWTFPGKLLAERSICVMPEIVKPERSNEWALCAGVCSDIVVNLKDRYDY